VRTFAIVTIFVLFLGLTAFFVIDTYQRVDRMDEQRAEWRKKYYELRLKLDYCEELTQQQEWRPEEEEPNS
jgi:cell division protein FtsB